VKKVVEDLKGLLLRYLKNCRSEVEEHRLLRRVPKHLRGSLKAIIKEMITDGKISFRVSGNRKLYRIR